MKNREFVILHAHAVRRVLAAGGLTAFGLLGSVPAASAQTAAAGGGKGNPGAQANSAGAVHPDDDQYDLTARSVIYARLFERALLPGPGGAQVATETLVPIHEYIAIRAIDLDSPGGDDSLDLELGGWGAGTFGSATGERTFDGDLSVANVSQRVGAGAFKVGRQTVAAGSLRLLHLDGVSGGARAPWGLGVFAYAGLTVLPRWAERPGYQHLGSVSDSLMRSPETAAEPNRSGYWLGGARLDYLQDKLGEAGISFHEEQEASALGRRELGADLHLTALEPMEASAAGLLDVDSWRLIEGLAALDWFLTPQLDVAAEYRRTDPQLLLSRQSVLSVFSTSAFDELGAEADYRLLPALHLGSGAYVQWLGADSLGTRLKARLRVFPLGRQRLRLQLAYGRVREPENGYHSARVSVRYRVVDPLHATVEHYSYFYDEPIRGIGSSSVEAANAEWRALRALRILVGASLARSPYAAADAQALLRASYAFDVVHRGGR